HLLSLLHRPHPHSVRYSFPTRRSSDLFVHHPQLSANHRVRQAQACCQSTPQLRHHEVKHVGEVGHVLLRDRVAVGGEPHRVQQVDRKSTRLNSSHQIISYAVFCLKKKN